MEGAQIGSDLSLLYLSLLIVGAGAFGGVLNALLSDNGFLLPRMADASGARILRPGALGNMLTGAVAAFISWGLYGPFASSYVLGGPDAPPTSDLVRHHARRASRSNSCWDRGR